MNNNMAMTIVKCGDFHVSVWLHTASDPTADGWAEGLERVAELKRKLGGDLSKIRTLALSDGGAPNTVQRSAMFAELLEGKSKVAAVSGQLSNRLLRGIATAISWLNPYFRAFPPDHFDLALEYLDLVEHREQLLRELKQLQKSIIPIQTLSLIPT